jgi:hypothetical protein
MRSRMALHFDGNNPLLAPKGFGRSFDPAGLGAAGGVGGAQSAAQVIHNHRSPKLRA